MASTISKSKLKARMLEVFRQLEKDGGELIVTDHDKPVLKIVRLKNQATIKMLFGDLQGRVVYHENINTSTLSEWDEV